MPFIISGLKPYDFNALFEISDAELESRSMRRYTADADFGYPDRISLTDVAAGQDLILLNYEHQPAPTPYRASGPIFVARSKTETVRLAGQIPDSLRRRPISLRAYSQDGMMVSGQVLDGQDLEPQIEALFAAPDIAYLHAHYASRGCYAARIDRA